MKISFLALFSIFYFLCLSPAFAQNRDNTLHFDVFNFPPYGYYNEKGESRGYLYEVAVAIKKQAAMGGRTGMQPMLRVRQNLQSGRTDCTIMIASEEVKRTYHMIEPIGRDLVVGVIPKAGIDLEVYEDLKGHRIGIPSGLAIYPRFDHDESLIKIKNKGYYHNALMLQGDRVDAIAGGIDSMMFNIHKIGMDESDVGKPLIFAKFPMWVLCAPGRYDETIANRIRDAVKDLREKGTFQRIFEKYSI